MKNKKYVPFPGFVLFFILVSVITANSSVLTRFPQIVNSGMLQTGSNKINPAQDFYFLPELENKNFFESINDMSICRYKLVRKFINQYLSEARSFLANGLTRSQRYLPVIKEIFEKYGQIPEELALLPLLESGFNPYATSRSKAVGLWQIMKPTSRDLGLKINSWVDERRDIEKSTEAAVRHLCSLYKIFNSWELALAAYNGGAARVKRAMIKTGAENFEELLESEELRRETNEFVHRFAALAVIYRNQELFDIKSEVNAPEIAETENIILAFPVRIKDLSGITGVPQDIIKMYNPELKKNVTPPYEKEYSVRIPKHSVSRYNKNKSKLYAVKFKKLKKHIVREGESLSKIAKTYKTKMQKIIQINNLKNPHLIKPGQEIYVPL
ncbi:MAG: transglycosylase SLT domain-containing protein [Spirochaetes bacterium]|nr:transglycosylase SLT domain-containing protein [Spirochaetota bacterium]